ncbi:type II toxin-antitoxin system VapC family toxin [Oscillatoria acuminata]|uniref:Putative nucleic acid-binding protein, contains PIN domain n=1 Tax=Oscillatoria acuminata PCC 6304 TaxID=56110 RepID=K9TEQ6_9CYAN|nr:type II toxin-antitoxin system VapC family toxin [Oscillatoria acuminata]AFY80499.1 putative nucleic acid-binding protein, contains PIN domain [Oscillatoria acuminata PCC 6304]
MTQFVVDANVAIKWMIPEIHSEAALRLRNPDSVLLVPDFFFPEIGNIFWKRVRRGETTLDNALEDLDALTGLPLQVHPSLPLMPQALEIAVRIQQAVYDCVYLALAVREKCQMVTADERFFNALQNDFLAPYLLWVEDLP